MRTTDSDKTAPATLAIALVAANALLLGTWPLLRSLPLGGDSTDVPVKNVRGGTTPQKGLTPDSVFRNSEYLASFFDAVRQSKAIFFLGTSETVPGYNLGAQLNVLFPQDPSMAVLAKPGTSPIHSALLFASCERERIAVPPLVMVINPVYFTYSHDVIDDGWMSSVTRSDVFAQINHRRMMQELSGDVRAIYAQHFESRRFLLPLYTEEYLGNLLYLSFHQSAPQQFSRDSLPIPRYDFEGKLPDYDRRGVHVGYRASDQLAKNRWIVKPVGDCLNLKGLTSTAAILRNQKAPVLLLVLPVNRTFYASNGLDMVDFDRRYRDIRNAIMRLEEPGHIFLVDLYDAPWLDRGFADRMHADAYGFRQMATHLGEDPTYARFIDAVRGYYASPSRQSGAP